MSDRELLELAAKAAGIELDWDIPINSNTPWRMSGEDEDRGPADMWNPLTDDGDALRLAVKLHLKILLYPEATSVDGHWCGGGISTCERYGIDPYAATRRAIVRAAAEIGKGT